MGKAITGAQFRTEFKRVKAGAYLFWGDENFIKYRMLTDLREKICADETMAAFNHFIFTRDNYTPDSLLAAMSAVPMMSDFKLVELYELPFAEYKKKEDLDAFESAAAMAEESDDTVLVIYTTPENFDAGEPKSPSALMKLLSKHATPVEFAHESTQRIQMWVQKHFAAEKIIAEPAECALLIDTVGHDMTTLNGEIEKLAAYLHFKERDKLEKVDIELVSSRNKEIGAFEFADAILDMNNEKAFWILGDMRMKNEPVPVILGGIIKIYTDLYALRLASDAGVTTDEAAKRLGLHPYVAKIRMQKAKSCERQALADIIELCAQTDAALKSSPLDDYILLERLIVQASSHRKRKIL
ncbi:MAG: DNA polymerase III subunit delta [Clostridia bacterium]|nr:DNA polymerase III subunit delta [Clostridia bacterium]